MTGIVRIRRHGFVGKCSDNILSEFQSIWSRGCQLGTQNVHTTRLFFTFEKQRKNKIWQHPSVKRLSQQGRYRSGISFLYNNRTVTVHMEHGTWNRYKFPGRRAVIYSPLFRACSENKIYLLIYYISAKWDWLAYTTSTACDICRSLLGHSTFLTFLQPFTRNNRSAF